MKILKNPKESISIRKFSEEPIKIDATTKSTVRTLYQQTLSTMKSNTVSSDSTGSHSLLTGAILIANLDYSGLAGYALRAVIGGAIWMVFKLAGDYISMRMAAKKKIAKQDETESKDEKEEE